MLVTWQARELGQRLGNLMKMLVPLTNLPVLSTLKPNSSDSVFSNLNSTSNVLVKWL